MIKRPPPLKEIKVGILILSLVKGGGLIITGLHYGVAPTLSPKPQTLDLVRGKPEEQRGWLGNPWRQQMGSRPQDVADTVKLLVLSRE